MIAGVRLCVVHAAALQPGSFEPDESSATAHDVTATDADFERWAKTLSRRGQRALALHAPAPLDRGELRLVLPALASISVRAPAAPTTIVPSGNTTAIHLHDLETSAWIDGSKASEFDLEVVAPQSCEVEVEHGPLRAAFSFAGVSRAGTSRASMKFGEQSAAMSALQAPLTAIEFSGGRWDRLELPKPAPRRARLEQVALRDVTLDRWAVIDRKASVVELDNVTADDIELTGLAVEHLWIRRSTIGELHGTAIAVDTCWIEQTALERCTLRAIAARSFAVVRSKVSGPITLAGSFETPPQLISVSGSSLNEEAVLDISSASRVAIDGLITDADVRIGTAQMPADLTAETVRSDGDAVLHVTQRSSSTHPGLADVRAQRSWRVLLHTADEPVTLNIADSQFDEKLHISGTSIQRGDEGERLQLLGDVSADELHLQYMDLRATTFGGVTPSEVKLGAGNQFTREGRRLRVQEDLDASLEPRRLANVYRGLRLNLETASDASLANDFYIGEMVARAKRTDIRRGEKAVLRLYATVGGWGVRPSRPTLYLVALITGVTALAFLGGIRTPPEMDLKRFALTLESLLPWARPSTRGIVYDPLFQVLLTPARIAVVVLAGFIALGLRSQVRR